MFFSWINLVHQGEICKVYPLNMKCYKPEQNSNRLLQKGPYQVLLLLLGGYRPSCTEIQMSLMVSHEQVNFRNEIEF